MKTFENTCWSVGGISPLKTATEGEFAVIVGLKYDLFERFGYI